MAIDMIKVRAAIDRATRSGMDSTGYRPTGAEVKIIVDEQMTVIKDIDKGTFDIPDAPAPK